MKKLIPLLLIILFIFSTQLIALAKDEKPTFTDASVHDPSVIFVNGQYYVFGSHLAAAKSSDLMNWELVASGATNANPLFEQVQEDLKETFEWAETDTLWAADVIQLKDGKFYMYYNASRGDSPRSALGVAVADDVEGPYKDKGIILKSGMWNQASEDGKIYDANIHPNVVDPHAFFDADGKYWMVYGSYSGGIFILEMDEETGYPLEGQGYGTHLIGGNHSRIEAPYIQYDPTTKYYYLYTTFGGLDSDGGYNVRVARSKKPDGPYLDAKGNRMSDVKGKPGSFFDDPSIQDYGMKIIGNHLITSEQSEGGVSTGYVSPGHNSVYYDEKTGEQFLIFHSRFPNRGEAHEIRVHQIFMNEEGWPVITPFRYAGESLQKLEKDAVIGEYKWIYFDKEIRADGPKSSYITLNEDGTFAGVESGIWEFSGENTIRLEIDGEKFTGVLVEQWNPTTSSDELSFSVMSAEGHTIWGAKALAIDDEEWVKRVLDGLMIANSESIIRDIPLPKTAGNGIEIFWTSSNESVITNEGVVIRPIVKEKDQEVVLTAKVRKGDSEGIREFTVKVLAEKEASLLAKYSFENDLIDSTGTQLPGEVIGEKIDVSGGNLAFKAGKFGQAAYFDGHSGVQLPDGLLTDNHFTISLWLNPEEVTPFTPTFFGIEPGSQWLSVVPLGPFDQTVVWSGENWYDGLTNTAIPINEWSHLAFSVENGEISIYLNGEQVFTGSDFPEVFKTNQSRFALGVNYWDAAFKGLIDELLIYDGITLTGEQVKSYYETGEVPLEKQEVDVSELLQLITKAEEMKENLYTKASYANLLVAIEKAKNSIQLIENEQDVQKAIIDLQRALDQLVLNEVEDDSEDHQTPGEKEITKDDEQIGKSKDTSDVQGEDKKLPNTSTNMYMILLFGLTSIFIGACIFVYYRWRMNR